MAFSCMTVIGNAELVSSEVTYDSIDDAILNPEQVADMALDLVDNDLLAGIEPMDLSILGTMNLSSVDNAINSICTLRCNPLWSVADGLSLIGDVTDLAFEALRADGEWGLDGFLGLSGDPKAVPYSRSYGDLVVISQLLQFLSDNAGTLGKVAYGLSGGNGLDLGLIDSFLDLGEVGDMLNDIPGMLVELVYDMLIHGSYNPNYDNESYPSVEELEEAGSALPTNVDTLDEIVDTAILNLLTNPQDYEWNGEGDEATKTWDTGSVILPSLKKVKDDYIAGGYTEAQAATFTSPLSNSLFGILDFLAQYALDDLAVNALNNNLKKALMEAVEIDLNEIPESEVDAAAKAVFDAEAYVNYIAYDCMEKGADGNWYYTTFENVPLDEDEDGEQDIDPETEEPLTERAHVYYKANMASANEFAALINWDWEFVGSNVTPTGDQIQLLYSNIVKDHDDDGTASIVEGINDLLYLVYDAALTDEVKADFKALVGTDYVAGANSNLMTNVNNIAKYLLVNHGEMIFGSTSPYAHLEYSKIKDMDTVDLIAMIGPGFFEDVMPQLIFPKNADGTYAFHDGVQIYEFGALVIREFISDITPNVEYDEYIFANGVDSEDGRQFATHTVDEWFNIILNMGLDIAYTYLYNITNFGDKIIFNSTGTGFGDGANWRNPGTAAFPDFPEVTATNVVTATRWQDMLDEVILWAARYVGSVTGTSVLDGFDVTTISGITGPLNKLSYILNKLLPLGFVNGYSSGASYNGVTYDFDVDLFLNNGLKGFFTDFDLARVLGLLGRNTNSKYNAFDDTTVVNAVLDLVNDILSLVFRTTILQGVNEAGLTRQSADGVVTQENLKNTIINLFQGLNESKEEILYNALPVVGKLIKGWGTEQAYQTPDIALSRSVALSNGATTEAQTVTVRNASNGVWRHYKYQDGTEGTDAQFQIRPVSVAAYNLDGTASSYVTIASNETADIPYGDTGKFTYTVTGVPTTGAIVRFDYSYKVLDEDGKELADGKIFKLSSYVWLNYADTDDGTSTTSGNDGRGVEWGWYKRYVDLSGVPSSLEGASLLWFKRTEQTATGKTTFKMSGSGDGLTFSLTEITLNNGDRSWNIQPYASGEYWAGGDNAGTTASEDCVTNTATFNQSTWEGLNKKSGDTGSVSASISGSKKPLLFGSATAFSGSISATFTYYDGAAMSKLTGLAGDEMNSPRLRDQYNRTGTSYANGILTSADVADDAKTEEDEFVLRDSNYSTLVWIDEDEKEYADSSVTDIVETTDDDGNVIAATGKVGDVPVKRVTAIDNATAWATYEAALVAGVRGGYQEFNTYSVYNFEELYNTLRVAVNDVQYLKKTTEELVAEGNVDDIDGDIDALKGALDDIEAATTDNRNYTDYQMYRLNRLNDAREDARYYINLQNDASNDTVEEIDESFPYTWIEEDDLRDLVTLKDENNVIVNDALQAVGGTDNANLVLALLEKLSDEEIDAKAEWLEGKKLEYVSTSLLDVQMAANYLDRVSGRLLYRFVDEDYNQEVITTYLDGELNSIDNMMGDVYDEAVSSQYTERSWAKFIAAYENAVLVYDDTEELPFTQKNVFDVKWELQCCRNELVLVDDEADYSELEALIEQAEYALANQSLYNNKAKELGQVLAELGIEEEIVNADGDAIQLFPGSAYYINSEPYDVDDQDVIDQKATELKEALARLKFKGLNITDDKGNANTSTGTLVADDPDTPDVDETLTATIANIAAELDADAVKALFNVTATGADVTVDNITVSNDLHYSVEKFDENGDPIDIEGFAGTNSVVTFYTVNSGVKIPVATVKIVVNGDINGDGAVDVLDGAYAKLVSTEKAELEGCYLLAGDLVGNDRIVGATDYQQIVGAIVA